MDEFDPRAVPLLERFGLQSEHSGVCLAPGLWRGGGPAIVSVNPANERSIGTVKAATSGDLDAAIASAHTASRSWRDVPAPRRGEAVRQFAMLLREHKDA
ncbi:MAG: aldehyde dehydrogenase family protein, partial [Burkholderiales bacterium]